MTIKDVIFSYISLNEKFDRLMKLGATSTDIPGGKIFRLGEDFAEFDSISDVWTSSDGEVFMENL